MIPISTTAPPEVRIARYVENEFSWQTPPMPL